MIILIIHILLCRVSDDWVSYFSNVIWVFNWCWTVILSSLTFSRMFPNTQTDRRSKPTRGPPPLWWQAADASGCFPKLTCWATGSKMLSIVFVWNTGIVHFFGFPETILLMLTFAVVVQVLYSAGVQLNNYWSSHILSCLRRRKSQGLPNRASTGASFSYWQFRKTHISGGVDGIPSLWVTF